MEIIFFVLAQMELYSEDNHGGEGTWGISCKECLHKAEEVSFIRSILREIDSCLRIYLKPSYIQVD